MKKYLVFASFFVITASVFAQVDSNSDLYKIIISKDSLLFNVGFNTCDISQFDALLSDKFEFFHDTDSISYKTEFIYSMRNGLCNSPDTYQSRRELVKESTEIYPLYKKDILYGAIQMGIHRFYETSKGKNETFASTAKFTHVWLLENRFWKLDKAFSYDHQTVDAVANKSSLFDNDEAIEKWLAENKVPTLGIGVIKNGKLQQVKVLGELRRGVTAPYNTIFNAIRQ